MADTAVAFRFTGIAILAAFLCAGALVCFVGPLVRHALTSTPPKLHVICDMEAGVVCFRDGAAMSCLPQSQVEPICPVGP